MLSSTINHAKASSEQNKFVQERISGVEKHFGTFCNAFGSYAMKSAKLRDKGDELAKSLRDYGDAEVLNKTLREALTQLSDVIASVEDYRNAKIQRMETLVVQPLAEYRQICRKVRQDIKAAFTVRQRELERYRSLERTHTMIPYNRMQLASSELRLQKTRQEALQACQNAETQMDSFEEKKISDLKKILLDFVQTELAFHAKGVEFFTKAYNDINSIDEKKDMEDFLQARDPLDRVFRNALGCSSPKLNGTESKVSRRLSWSSDTPDLQLERVDKREKKKFGKSGRLQLEEYEEIHSNKSSDSD